MITTSILKKKQKQGLIRGFRITSASKKGERKKFFQKVGKEKYWMEIILQEWCEKKGYKLVPEYTFHPHRKWRIDYFIPDIKTGIEYEGVMSEKSRHTTVTGYSNDSQKYNEAAKMGIKILRYTVLNYKNLVKDLPAI